MSLCPLLSSYSEIGFLKSFLRRNDNRATVMQSPCSRPIIFHSTRPPTFLQAFCIPPLDPPGPNEIISSQYATMDHSSLLQSSSRLCQLALGIRSLSSTNASSSWGYPFLPADSRPPTTPPCQRRGRKCTTNPILTLDRLIIAYSSSFIQCLWEEPKAIQEFLEGGGLGMVRASVVF